MKMVEEQSTEGNELIAQFMDVGHYISHGRTYYIYANNTHRIESNLHYQNDWNWIIPVIRKIENLGYWWNKIDSGMSIDTANGNTIVHEVLEFGEIEELWNLIVEFINWYNKSKLVMTEFKKYKRTNTAEMRPYIKGEDLTNISVPPEDDPETDMGMIARNPDNYRDQWYVNRAYYEKNFRRFEKAKAVSEFSKERADVEMSLVYLEPSSGFHIALDKTYMDQVGDLEIELPTGEVINTADL